MIRAFLDGYELLLACASGPPIHSRNVVIPVHRPVRVLSPSLRRAIVVVPELYPRRGVALDFEVDGARRAVAPSKNVYRVGQVAFEAQDPSAWRGARLDDLPPARPEAPDVPRPPSTGRAYAVGDPGAAGDFVLAAMDAILDGDRDRAYAAFAPVYRRLVARDEFERQLARHAAPERRPVAREVAGFLEAHPCSFCATVQLDAAAGVQGFFDVARDGAGFALLTVELRRYPVRPPDPDPPAPE